jgi:hypothetical protein
MATQQLNMKVDPIMTQDQEEKLLTKLFGEPKPLTEEQKAQEVEYQKQQASVAYETAEALADARGRLVETSELLREAVKFADQYDGYGKADVEALQGALHVFASQLEVASMQWRGRMKDHEPDPS